MIVKSNFFVRFLGELKIPIRHFEINWPLAEESQRVAKPHIQKLRFCTVAERICLSYKSPYSQLEQLLHICKNQVDILLLALQHVDLLNQIWSIACAEILFCYQNCSDLLWEKTVLVTQKNFWNIRLKADNLQNFWGH